MANLDDLSAQLAQLEARLGMTTDMISAFDSELGAMGRNLVFTSREVDGLSRSLGSGLAARSRRRRMPPE